MNTKKSRLQKAEEKYCAELHEWLTNPKNEDIPNETVEHQVKAAFDEFLQALMKDEDECARFIAEGGIMDELDFLPLIFEHFKTPRILEAIEANCEAAFSHKHGIESEETERERKEMLSHMRSAFEL